MSEIFQSFLIASPAWDGNRECKVKHPYLDLSVFSYCFASSSSTLYSSFTSSFMGTFQSFLIASCRRLEKWKSLSLPEGTLSVFSYCFSASTYMIIVWSYVSSSEYFQSFLIASLKRHVKSSNQTTSTTMLSVFSYCFPIHTLSAISLNVVMNSLLSVFSYCFSGEECQHVEIVGNSIKDCLSVFSYCFIPNQSSLSEYV